MPIRDTGADRKHTFANYCPDDVRASPLSFFPLSWKQKEREGGGTSLALPRFEAWRIPVEERRGACDRAIFDPPTTTATVVVATTREHACKNAQHASPSLRTRLTGWNTRTVDDTRPFCTISTTVWLLFVPLVSIPSSSFGGELGISFFFPVFRKS